MTDDDLGSRKLLMDARADRSPLVWYPAQVDVSIRPGWFYHKHEDLLVRSVNNLLNIYYGSVGGNSQLLLNVPPDKRGLFQERDVQRLGRLGRVLKSTFSENLASDAVASASAVRGPGEEYSAQNTIDSDPSTYWMTDDWQDSAEIEFKLSENKTLNVILNYGRI